MLQKAFRAVFAYTNVWLEGKSPLRSKTIWAFLVSWAAMYVARKTGMTLTPDQQASILVGIGIVMRMITKQPVGFYEDENGGEAASVPK